MNNLFESSIRIGDILLIKTSLFIFAFALISVVVFFCFDISGYWLVCSFLSGYLVQEDVRYRMLPFRGLTAFCVLSLLGNISTIFPPLWFGLSMALVLFFLWAAHRSLVGAGDPPLLLACLLWTPVEMIPFFLLTTGIFGVFYVLVTRERFFPLGSLMLLSWWGVTLFHHHEIAPLDFFLKIIIN